MKEQIDFHRRGAKGAERTFSFQLPLRGRQLENNQHAA
ncbi:hypothetical protein D1BOALGB6SA_4538 [Olavius sp. associated proteobacterium Delta 1]|nr:hypothetical protein D1BOALGB6SA_4538 [Olavius sp. associated proteobacterium Delta 1]